MLAEQVPLPLLGADLRFEIAEEDRWAEAALRKALAVLQTKHPSDRAGLTPHVFAYYNDVLDGIDMEWWPDGPRLTTPEEIWSLVTPTGISGEVVDWDETGLPDLRIEAEVAWDPEHGMWITFAGGELLTAVGPQGYGPEAGVIYAAADPRYMTYPD